MSDTPFERYGALWPAEMDELQVEMACVRLGGQWKSKKGVTCGLGMSHHLERMRRIIWPELDGDHNGQRWHTLCRDTICSHKITVLMGCGSSGKTHEAAWTYLCEWLCDPENTVVLVSSTDMRGLKLRVWGEITSLWERAVNRFDYLPGHLLDSALAITFESIDDKETDERKVRDLRQAIIGIPTVQGGKQVGLSKWQGIKQKKVRLVADEAACFPAGEMVETSTGMKPIEQVQIGDFVRNAIGFGRVSKVHKRTHSQFVKIKTRDGRVIICTPSHPIFTERGWEQACHVSECSYMVSAYEAMHIMRSGIQAGITPNALHSLPTSSKTLRALREGIPPKTATRNGNSFLRPEMQAGVAGKYGQLRKDVPKLQRSVSWETPKHPLRTVPSKNDQPGMQAMRELVPSAISQFRQEILFPILFVEMDNDTARISEEILYQGAQRQDKGGERKNLFSRSCALRRDEKENQRAHGELHVVPDSRTEARTQIGDEPNPEIEWSQADDSWRERNRANESRGVVVEILPGSSLESSNQDRHEGRKRLSDVLQGGLGIPGNKTGGRGGWIVPSITGEAGTRREENELFNGDWVDSVKVYEQKDSGGFREREAGVAVYNLEVEGHPSYSVNGFLVHNCMSGSFLSAFSNLNNNEDFRAIILGNPSDTLDPLGKAAEPIDGWDAHMQPDKTSVWKTRFMNGACVNLIGTDSPNFDFPPNERTRFKYLISKEKIQDTESFFPKESFEWYSQCHGSMKIATLSTAVLTRRLCEQNNAFEKDVIWLEGNRTKVWFTDAAYGGDRCVGGYAEFGKLVNGGVAILYHPPVIIPILASVDEEPEHQIAVFMKKECEAIGIPPENASHDATGRGSLGTFLARVWSAATHPIESGGTPTDRPMSADIYWNDPQTGQRRLKTCREGYSKRISEYWFSVRYAVQAGQVRGLEEDTVDEFRMRKWKRVSGDRMELESKSDMKERIGRSPDLADWCAGVLEMARRKGFMISKLSNDSASSHSPTWLRDLARNQQNLLRSKELVH